MSYESLFRNSDIKNHFGWKVAICQHPMYLVIDEDRGEPVLGERIPPWGAPNADEYTERIRRNLEALKKYSDLRINYEFSGAEMEAIAEKFPDVIAGMKDLYEKGRLDFVNGTYAQPHLHTLGSESNWRQFETGLEVYKRFFGKQVKVYQHQETGVHLQLPQILRRFGYDFMTLPSFRWLMSIESGNLELTGDEVHGIEMYGQSPDNFVDANGLDGTVIPAYINSRSSYHNDRVYAIRRDLVQGRKIWIMNPDMMEVDDNQYKDLNAVFTTTLLEDAFRETWLKDSAHNSVRIYTNWSYVEGMWAEELLRRNKQAEENAVLAENLCCLALLKGRAVDYKAAIKSIWHDILKYQHHDVHWNEVTDLRQKAIDKLEAGIRLSRDLSGRAAAAYISGDADSRHGYVSFFNAASRARRVPVELDPGVFTKTPSEGFQRYGDRIIGTVELPAFSAVSVKTGGLSGESVKAALPRVISTPLYEAELSDDGLLQRIVVDGKDILRAGEYLGGELRCIADDTWHSNRGAQCSYYTGPVFDVLERRNTIAGAAVLERYFFYKTLAGIKVELEFGFNGNEIGNYWADYSKLNVYFPTSGEDIHHDIPFGYQEGRADRTLYAINWMYSGGLAYVNRGTPKHWVSGGLLTNMLAWGSNHFDNRVHYDWNARMDIYDQRLRGRRAIEYYLLPYAVFDGNKICADTESLTFPVFAAPGRADVVFHPPLDDGKIITALHEKDGEIFARGYALPFNRSLRNFEIFDNPLGNIR
jgi:hypothetical protein